MNLWHVMFEKLEFPSGKIKKEYRSYPCAYQWSSRELLSKELMNRTYLKDYTVALIKLT
jgi:hypothetical protein